MTTQLFYCLIPFCLHASVVGRLGRRKFSLHWQIIAAVAAAAMVILPILTGANWVILTAATVGLIIITTTIIATIRNGNLARTVVMFTNLAFVALVLGNENWVTGFNGATISAASWIAGNNALAAQISSATLHTLMVVLSGLIIVTVEINHPIALFLKRTKLMPEETSANASPEPARGRAIGYLERAIVFILTLTGNFAGLGLVLVAKGIARFQQLNDRDFAEYVLIGTLLSIGAAMFTGFVFSHFR